MDIVTQPSFSWNLLIGFVAFAVFTHRRKIFYKVTKMFCSQLKWQPFLKKMKKGMQPMFSFDHTSTDNDKIGLTSPEDAYLKENPRCLVADKNAIDSLNMWGADNSGNALMLRVARRHDRQAEVWIYLRLESGEEFQAPIQPDLNVCNTDGKSFSTRGLYYEVLEPLKRIRIGFNGQLRKGVKITQSSEEDQTVSIQFNFMHSIHINGNPVDPLTHVYALFKKEKRSVELNLPIENLSIYSNVIASSTSFIELWHPMFSYSAYPLDFNPDLMAAFLSKQKLTFDFLESWSISPTEWHEQWGQMYGQVKLGNHEYTLMLTGTKAREHGICDWNTIERRLVIKGFNSIATGVTLFAESDKDGSLKVYHGQVVPPSNIGIYSVSECTMDEAEQLFEDTDGEISIDLVAANRKYNIKLNTAGPGFVFYAEANGNVRGRCRLTKLNFNGKEGFAYVETYEKHSEGYPVSRQRSATQLKEPDYRTTEKLVVPFTDDVCQSGKIVGGKGASLALMTSLTSKNNEFEIPPGVCLTKTSFELHLTENPAIANAIENLQDVAWTKKAGKLTEECARVSDLICNSSLSNNLCDELKANLHRVFDNAFDGVKFAVRSSAIGEDSEEMSAAGQNETFLGVKGLEKIFESILKCWASQFSFRSVEYKRQNGQLMNGGMGVVIQQMVPADVAGVLFSKDPTNGSVARMAITANYGLGESVVSATADPDKIMLHRTWGDHLSIAEKTVGKKELKTIMSDEGGTLEIRNEDSESAQLTVSDDLALRLGRIAVELEHAFGTARDIEWAVHKDNIFLPQARPVTSDSVLTDFDVLHEFDSTFRTQTEHLSTGNFAISPLLGEILPGSISPLSITSNLLTHGLFFQKYFTTKIHNFRYDPTVLDCSTMYTSHGFFDLVQQQAGNAADNVKSTIAKAMEVGLYGKVLDDTESLRMVKERFNVPSADVKKLLLVLAVTGLIKDDKLVASLEAKYGNYPIPTEGTITPQEAYDKVSREILQAGDAFKKHLQITFASMIWNTSILLLLSGGSAEFTPDHYADFAALIGGSIGAESGNVPKSLQEVAASIAEEFDVKEFGKMPVQEALDLLQASSSTSLTKFQAFLTRHGHRGMKEFDVSSTSWGLDTSAVVKMLQDIINNPVPVVEKMSLPASEVVKSMKTPLSAFKKKLLVWLINRSRNAVCNRERAKSMLIKLSNVLRISFRHLDKLMVEHGNIPDAQLMFFMTLPEVDELIKTRSARIIMRARRRLRQYPYMDSIMYPEFTVGVPVPINKENEELIPEGTMNVTGLPVCHGRIIGMARVIMTFDEVDTIEANDILITHATDIGWSPYFPRLSGLVTEIGGLVSHGAVIAREYGIPCIISATNSMKVFKTGDRVLLDAMTGTITKLSDRDTGDS